MCGKVCVLKHPLNYKDMDDTIHSLLKTSQLHKDKDLLCSRMHSMCNLKWQR